MWLGHWCRKLVEEPSSADGSEYSEGHEKEDENDSESDGYRAIQKDFDGLMTETDDVKSKLELLFSETKSLISHDRSFSAGLTEKALLDQSMQ